MITTEEQIKRVKENFQKILDEHDKHGLPVVIIEEDKIYYLWKDGRKKETERSKLRNKEK